MEKLYLSIIIPAYNEEEHISSTLSEVMEYLKDKDFSCEVIVIDDGSTDKTRESAKEFQGRLANFRLIESSPNGGKGYVLKKAIAEAKGEYIAFMDADSSVSVKELDKFLPLLGDGNDIYIASRRVPGSEMTMPKKRDILGRIYIMLVKLFLGVRANDINCGFKVFKGSCASEVFSTQVMKGWTFDAEILFIAERLGYRIKEVPIKWEYKGTSKVRIIKDCLGSFLGLVEIRLNALKGKYTPEVRGS